MTISTRPRDAGDSGAELVVEHGAVGDLRPAGRPAGTTVDVADLFAETPARRKYLKRPATEFAHVNRAVTRYALANPDVAVSLTHDGREVFATTGTGDVRDAALQSTAGEVACRSARWTPRPEAPSSACTATSRPGGDTGDPGVPRDVRERALRARRRAPGGCPDAYGGQPGERPVPVRGAVRRGGRRGRQRPPAEDGGPLRGRGGRETRRPRGRQGRASGLGLVRSQAPAAGRRSPTTRR